MLKTRNSMIIPIMAAAALIAIPSIAAPLNWPLVAGVVTASVGTLHVVVKNTDGCVVCVPVIVLTDPPGSALDSCAAASFGCARFGESNRLLQPVNGGIVIFITGELPSRRTVVLVYKPGAP